MADRPINNTLNIKTLLSNDILYVARVSTGMDCYISVADFITATSTYPVSNVTCQYNNTTNILIASAEALSSGNFKSATIDCYFERNGKARKQIVEVFYIGGAAQILEGSYATIPNTESDLGISLAASCAAGLTLDVTVDSDANDVDFYYVITSIISL